MFPLPRSQGVHLGAAGFHCPHAAANPEQDQFGNVPKIKTHSAAIRPAIFANLEPNNVGLVSESPRFHYAQSLHQKSVWNPQVQVGSCGSETSDRQIHDLLELHSRVSQKATVFRRHFPRAILKLPGRVCEYSGKPAVDFCGEIRFWAR